MIRKILLGAAGVSALATAVGVTLVAAAFALYALLKPQVGGPGASAIVAAAAAILIAILALVLGRRPASHKPPPDPSPVERFSEMMRERPVLAAAGALAAGIIALKNPRLAATLASAFAAKRAAEPTDRRHRR